MTAEATKRGRRNKAAGKQREKQWAELLKADGWEVAFVPRVNGVQDYDILACKGGHIDLWEVKSTMAGPFADFGPAKRQALREAASRAGGLPRLCYWPYNRTGRRTIDEWEWPS